MRFAGHQRDEVSIWRTRSELARFAGLAGGFLRVFSRPGTQQAMQTLARQAQSAPRKLPHRWHEHGPAGKASIGEGF